MKFSTEAKIGIIVLSTLALVIWGINYLKGRNVLKRTDVYYAVYDDVAGLKLSGSVIMSGFKVGSINNIEFLEGHIDKVIVAFVINTNYSIPKGSIAQIYNNDILGNKVIRIIPSGQKEYYSYGDTLSGNIDPDLASKIQNQIDPLVKTASNAILGIDTLVSSVNRILDTDTQKKIQASLTNLEASSSALANQLSQGGDLDKTIASLQLFAATLEKNKEKLTTVFSNLESITDSIASSNLKETIASINATFVQSSRFLEQVNNGEGSLGLLATNDSLYNNLAVSSQNLAILLEDMNKHPKRYVHFSIFGRKDK